MICLICHKEFIKNTNNQKYCSIECRKINKKEYSNKYSKSDKQKDYRKIYWQSDRGKKVIDKHRQTDKYKEYQKSYYKDNKLKVIEYYSNGTMQCNCCGENQIEFLTIDHINCGKLLHGKNRKIHKISGTNLYLDLIKNNFPKGYQILCFNCNCAKGTIGKCPHEIKKFKTTTI